MSFPPKYNYPNLLTLAGDKYQPGQLLYRNGCSFGGVLDLDFYWEVYHKPAKGIGQLWVRSRLDPTLKCQLGPVNVGMFHLHPEVAAYGLLDEYWAPRYAALRVHGWWLVVVPAPPEYGGPRVPLFVFYNPVQQQRQWLMVEESWLQLCKIETEMYGVLGAPYVPTANDHLWAKMVYGLGLDVEKLQVELLPKFENDEES